MRSPVLVLGLLWLAASTASGETYLVLPGGSGDFPTIQAAIDGIVDGEIIELGDGVFRGDGNRDVLSRGKSFILRSQSGDPTRCMIDCEGSEDVPHRAFVFESGWPGAILEDVTIMNGHADWGGAVVSGSDTIGASTTFIRCIFMHNKAEYGGAIVLDGQPSIISCTFYQNEATDAGSSIYSDDWGYAFVYNCIIAFGLGAGNAVEGWGAELYCCDVYGNAGGDWPSGTAGNISLDPLFCSPVGQTPDLHLQEGSPCAPFTPPNDECDLIGALPVQCGTTPAGTMTWGRIKSLYR